MADTIPLQLKLKYELPSIHGNKDYREFKQILERIDQILMDGKIEDVACDLRYPKYFKVDKNTPSKQPTLKEKMWFKEHTVKALRCNIARELMGESFRATALRMADSGLLQRFCNLGSLDGVKVPSKSTLESYSKMFSAEDNRKLINEVIRKASQSSLADHPLKLEEPLDLSEAYFDTTCLKSNIHFPVDWVLLRDATRTLMKAVMLIRKEGLINRMNAPETFMKKMNQFCIEMTHSRRKKDSKKMRKKILRKMKQMSKVVARHAKIHQELLETKWGETQLSEKQAQQIISRIKNVLNQLPKAMAQAHERIIGERQVPSKDKILSLYEPDVNVIVRGKAGAEVEFGNSLLIAEQKNGVILDWKFIKEHSPGDQTLLLESLKRIHKDLDGYYPETVIADRGFDSKEVDDHLEDKKIKNAIMPRDVTKLKQKRNEIDLARFQVRRGQTEARIAILKNGFLGSPIRSKGFRHKEMNVSSAVLAHNFWVLARLPVAQKIKEELPLAA